ncbi:MAG TPA: hydrogenase maturation protease [Anaerolineaceae bacterium]|nr:hydrogenase maturation protease [Anaerolineaceae bacterium]
MNIPSTLIIGYGNPDRQDDGVAWHVLALLAEHFGYPKPDDGEVEFFPAGQNPDLLFSLQLTPEMVETISRYDRVLFIDAHTGEIAQEINIERLESRFQTSPLTHHLTPQTLLSLVSTLYQKDPQAILVSIRGFEFEFSHDLSPQTAALAPKAAGLIEDWWDRPDYVK